MQSAATNLAFSIEVTKLAANTCGTESAERTETYVERLIRHISRDNRITPAHAKAAMVANGLLKESCGD